MQRFGQISRKSWEEQLRLMRHISRMIKKIVTVFDCVSILV